MWTRPVNTGIVYTEFKERLSRLPPPVQVGDVIVSGLVCLSACLWPPYVIGQAIYIFMLWFLLLLFFISSPNLSGRRLDVYYSSTRAWCGLKPWLQLTCGIYCMQ